jgi:hypothetical protein
MQDKLGIKIVLALASTAVFVNMDSCQLEIGRKFHVMMEVAPDVQRMNVLWNFMQELQKHGQIVLMNKMRKKKELLWKWR